MQASPVAEDALSLDATAQQLGWNEPAEPMTVVGPIHFVGTQGLSAWLITTTDGHLLLNTGMPPSGPMIEASIKQLGFDPKDVKLLLTCHAHVDHVGGLAYLKRITGAQVVAMDTEVELLQSGGKTDFNYGAIAEFQFEPVTVDRVIRDGEKVTLGDVTLTAHKTAGHTRGSTTWVTSVTDGGRTYTVVFPDGTSVNPGYRLVKNPSYHGIADDYRRTFETLAALDAGHLADAAHRTVRVRRETRARRDRRRATRGSIPTATARGLICSARNSTPRSRRKRIAHQPTRPRRKSSRRGSFCVQQRASSMFR